MKPTVQYAIILVLLLPLVMGIFPIKGSAILDLPVQNVNTGVCYPTIQEAIDASATLDGQTILVNNGTYNENVVVRKNLTIMGVNGNTTVISFTINNLNYCRISEFSVDDISVSNSRGIILDKNVFQNAECLIYIENSGNIIVYGNTLMASGHYGIRLNQTSNIIISGNSFTNSMGISDVILQFSSRCIIDGNLMSEGFGNAITLDTSDENTIENNWMYSKIWDGIDLQTSHNNTIIGNTIESNWRGIVIGGEAYGNTIYNNSLIDNEEKMEGIPRQVVIYGSNTKNYWNNSQGNGNYWSDYKEQDLNNDSIGDTPYVIDNQNQDNYPSMRPYAISQQKLQVLYHSLQNNNTALQNDYADLQTEQENIHNELLTVKTQMYILMITTAVFVLVSILLLASIIQRKHSSQKPRC